MQAFSTSKCVCFITNGSTIKGATGIRPHAWRRHPAAASSTAAAPGPPLQEAAASGAGPSPLASLDVRGAADSGASVGELGAAAGAAGGGGAVAAGVGSGGGVRRWLGSVSAAEGQEAAAGGQGPGALVSQPAPTGSAVGGSAVVDDAWAGTGLGPGGGAQGEAGGVGGAGGREDAVVVVVEGGGGLSETVLRQHDMQLRQRSQQGCGDAWGGSGSLIAGLGGAGAGQGGGAAAVRESSRPSDAYDITLAPPPLVAGLPARLAPDQQPPRFLPWRGGAGPSEPQGRAPAGGEMGLSVFQLLHGAQEAQHPAQPGTAAAQAEIDQNFMRDAAAAAAEVAERSRGGEVQLHEYERPQAEEHAHALGQVYMTHNPLAHLPMRQGHQHGLLQPPLQHAEAEAEAGQLQGEEREEQEDATDIMSGRATMIEVVDEDEAAEGAVALEQDLYGELEGEGGACVGHMEPYSAAAFAEV